ncbi:phospholipid carrier-dependent glycosyltransferase [Edaphobacter albus]|uniref:phospholipid carrier-dependent glycosyltransferase n=1 Tax=Edaphobacter sp. 4G125 TaxID=2763071 RepID=UPI001645459E|nr:phospholipid carrier-dependent glycosyltransferase [Edaphobacter sp. 4G125]QNI37108.1 phospholipid carrier-dependent glycosyltransferase [Edaphobacter sp. 4G125]
MPIELTPVKRNRLILLVLWFVFYSSFTLLTPPLLDDADSVHAEVAREMLVRHDWTTLYANGIRYLEKAPLLYWSMATSFKVFGVGTAAARIPLALTVLALVFALEAFARRAFSNVEQANTGPRAGLYAGLILLSSFGIFIFTRITIPDAMVCLWQTLAIFCFWVTEQEKQPSRLPCFGFAVCCALNVLTKGLIGIVFPVGIIAAYLILTRGVRGAIARILRCHPFTSAAIFFAIAAPWHILIGLANPTQGDPGSITFHNGHWIVPQPTNGNVHGWTWFYFVNEHLLRYLNLRVPRDYDTVPLLLFWGLILIWLMPWSAFLFHSLTQIEARAALAASPLLSQWNWLQRKLNPDSHEVSLTPQERTLLLLGIWAALPLLFFSFSTRQEYYVLPSLPALVLLIASWLTSEVDEAESFSVPDRKVKAGQRIALVLLMFGSVIALAALFFIMKTQPPDPNTDLASLLQQNPGEYALSFGHFLDLNGKAMGAFRTPLGMTAFFLFGGTLAAFLLRRSYRPHLGNLWLAGGAFGFLLAAHLGLQIFSPVLTSKQLADAIAPQLKPDDLLIIHGEYEAGSTLGFYLQRNDIHIFEGRSSNLWYGSFFPDAPRIFENEASLNLQWTGPQRVFLWQDVSQPLPKLRGRSYLVLQSGGKELLSNRPFLFQ